MTLHVLLCSLSILMQALLLVMNIPVYIATSESLSLSVDDLVDLSPGATPSQTSGNTRCNGGMAHWRSSWGHWCMSTKMTKQFLS